MAATNPTGSVSKWIQQAKQGEDLASEKLWNRYYDRLLGVARVILKERARRVADEEDVVAEAFHSFLRRIQAGSYPDLDNRDDLWRMLVTIATRKALNQVRNLQRKKRSVHIHHGTGHPNNLPATRLFSVEDLPSQDPSPDVVIMMEDCLKRLLTLLEDQELRQVALLKLDGHSNESIAKEIGRSLPTVERRLRLIRYIWRDWEQQ